ncbi:unnamed protein product [Linum trigynum]|uniref:Gnk2-homologous domain-containing protein n=1 Tax=Linum trigynum TaxID=586398 RepID=A0AAV2CMV0_9ROSI
MAVLVRRLDARMGTVLISSLVLTMINVGFPGGVMIITAEAALDPLCGASNEWFCSQIDFNISASARIKIISKLTSKSECTPVYEDEDPNHPVAYMHSTCAEDNDTSCRRCFKIANDQILDNCTGKDGAQYGTDICCVRYDKNNFCGAIIN